MGVFCFLKLTICTHRGPTNFSAMKMVTTVKITEFKERNLSTDLICLAQLVQGGGCSYHSPLPRYIRLYQRYKIEGLHPNRGSNRLWIQISEQRKKSRLILQSGMYTFCVTSRARPFFFRVCIYRRLGQAKMLQNSVNKYKWKEGMGGGGVPVFVLQIIRIQTAISQVIYETLQNFFQL